MKVWIVKYHLDGIEKNFVVKESDLPEGCSGDSITLFVFRRFYETVPDFDDIALVRRVIQDAVA